MRLIVRHGDALVLVRADDNPFMPGAGDLPGGYVLPGEPLDEAIDREVREETGLAVTRIQRYLGAFDYTNKRRKHVTQLNFAVEVQAGSVRLHDREHKGFEWCNPCSPQRFRALGCSPEAQWIFSLLCDRPESELMMKRLNVLQGRVAEQLQLRERVAGASAASVEVAGRLRELASRVHQLEKRLSLGSNPSDDDAVELAECEGALDRLLRAAP